MDTLIDDLIDSRPAAKPATRTRVDPEAATTRIRVPSRKTMIRALVVGGLAVLIAVGIGAYAHFAGQVSTDDAQVDAHIAPIAAKISGSVAEILVNDNQLRVPKRAVTQPCARTRVRAANYDDTSVVCQFEAIQLSVRAAVGPTLTQAGHIHEARVGA